LRRGGEGGEGDEQVGRCHPERSEGSPSNLRRGSLAVFAARDENPEMPQAHLPFPVTVKRIALAPIVLLFTATAIAADAPRLGNKAEQLISAALPVCSEEAKITRAAMPRELPLNLVGNV